MKATEMLQNLVSAGLTDDEANAIVKGKVEAGTVEDDGIAKSESDQFTVDIQAVEMAADAIAKAVSVKNVSDKEGNDAAVGGHPQMDKPVQKDMSAEGGEEEEEESSEEEGEEAMEYSKKSRASDDDYDVVAIISKGADQILDSVERQNSALAKGYGELSTVTVNLVKAMSEQSKKYDELAGKFDTVLKALGQPVPPRSISGTHEVIPAPGETELAPVAKAGEIDPRVQLLAKANEELRSTNDRNRQHDLALAVAELDSGASVETIVRRYGISVG